MGRRCSSTARATRRRRRTNMLRSPRRSDCLHTARNLRADARSSRTRASGPAAPALRGNPSPSGEPHRRGIRSSCSRPRTSRSRPPRTCARPVCTWACHRHSPQGAWTKARRPRAGSEWCRASVAMVAPGGGCWQKLWRAWTQSPQSIWCGSRGPLVGGRSFPGTRWRSGSRDRSRDGFVRAPGLDKASVQL